MDRVREKGIQDQEGASALTRSQQRLALATSSTGIGMFEWDIETGRAQWDSRLELLLGYPCTTTTTTETTSHSYADWAKRVHPDDLARMEDAVKRCIANHSTLDETYRIVWPDSSVHWICARGIIHYDRSGQAQRMIGTAQDVTAAKESEQSLERMLQQVDETRKRLEAVVENSPAGICVWRGPDLVCEVANPTYRRFAPGTQFIGRTFAEIWPDAIEHHTKIMRQVMETGEPFFAADMPARLRRSPEGPMEDAFFTVFYSALPRDASGQAAVLNFALETTKQVQTLDALRKSEERFALAARATQDGLWDWNLETNEVFYSARWRELLGYEESEIEPSVSAWKRLLHPDDVQPTMRAVEAALRGEAEYTIEFRMRHKDGGYRHVLSRGIPVRREPNGPFVRIVGTHFDLTERKRVEQEVERMRSTLAEAQRIAHLGSWEYIVATRATIWSDEEKRIYGLAPTDPSPDYEAIRHHHFHPEDAAEVDRCFEDALQHNATFVNENRIIRPDGSVRWVSNKAEPYFDEHGTLLRYVGTTVDITERKQAEEALRQLNVTLEQRVAERTEALAEADRKKDEFLAVLAHELRNPMAAISAAGTLLSRPGLEPDKMELARETIVRRTQQLARLVDDLLDVSRITRGKIELKKEHVDLQAAIGQAVEATQGYFEAREQALRLSVSGPLPVFGDPIRLEQIVTNLLTNASRYSDRGQTTDLQAFREEAAAVVRVKDQGMGISAELLPQIFEPFHRGATPLVRSDGGLGLGLTIVKRLCEMHGGTVSVQSAGLGKGSEFEVRLPLGESCGAASAAKPSSRTAGPLHILLVEDQSDTAFLAATMLKNEGHQVDVAYDGLTAVDKAISMKPDVVLLDIGLPGLDGYQVAARIRKAGLTDVFIIAITGYGQPQDILRAQKAGIDRHLVKPIEGEDLAAVLAEGKANRRGAI